MGLEIREAEHIIEYHKDDVDSIRLALEKYVYLLEEYEAFDDCECIVGFRHTGGPIGMNHFEWYPELQKFIIEKSYYFFEDSNRNDLATTMTSESLFFLCAVVYPGLEEEIKKTCEKMVLYMNDRGCPEDVLLTEEYPFGLEALHIVATKYPKYGYLLGAFIHFGWDEELEKGLSVMADWVKDIGITKDSIKAYCYCDNSRARNMMLGYDFYYDPVESVDQINSNFDLLSYFKNYPNAIDFFAETYTNKLKEYPLYQYVDEFQTFSECPIRERVMELMFVHDPMDYDMEEDEEEYIEKPFLNMTGAQAADKIKEAIEQKLGHSVKSN